VHFLYRFLNHIYVSNVLPTLSGQVSSETQYGLAPSVFGIVHGLSPAWRKVHHHILRANRGSQITYNADIPISPSVDNHIQSLVVITDNTVKELALSYDSHKEKTTYNVNGYLARFRERVLGPSDSGQVCMGHWQHYNTRFIKNDQDRIFSVIAHGCATAEEFFRRISFFGSPILSSFHRFDIRELNHVAGKLNAELGDYQVVTDFYALVDDHTDAKRREQAIFDMCCFEDYLNTVPSKAQAWLDEELRKIATPLESLL